MSVRFKECLVRNVEKDAYCGKPATTNVGKLPACDTCALELKIQLQADGIERHLRKLDERLEWLAARTGHPVTAKKWRDE